MEQRTEWVSRTDVAAVSGSIIFVTVRVVLVFLVGVSVFVRVRVREAVRRGRRGRRVEKSGEDGLSLHAQFLEFTLESKCLSHGGVAQLVGLSLDDTLDGTQASIGPALDTTSATELLEGGRTDAKTLGHLVQWQMVERCQMLWGNFSL